MLNILFTQISNIVNIEDISDTNGVIEIRYDVDNLPNQLQLAEINNILSLWPLTKIKLQKIKELDENWKQVIQNGWTTSYGYKLGIDIQDITLLNGAFTLAKEASSIGITDLISIVDLDGNSHQLSLQELTLLMLQYGQARASLSNSYAVIKQSINAATTIQELEAINTNI
jgi:hypothetical protein